MRFAAAKLRESIGQVGDGWRRASEWAESVARVGSVVAHRAPVERFVVIDGRVVCRTCGLGPDVEHGEPLCGWRLHADAERLVARMTDGVTIELRPGKGALVGADNPWLSPDEHPGFVAMVDDVRHIEPDEGTLRMINAFERAGVEGCARALSRGLDMPLEEARERLIEAAKPSDPPVYIEDLWREAPSVEEVAAATNRARREIDELRARVTVGRRGGKTEALRRYAGLGRVIMSADTSKAEAQIAAAHENVKRLETAAAIRDILSRRGLRALGFELAGGRPC